MSRIAIVLLVLLGGAFQDASPVAPIVAQFDSKDSAQCLRALAGLLALPPEHRKEIDEAAAKLPDFYRDALRSELKTRDTLGEKFGKDVRVTLKAGDRQATAHLEDLAKQSGMKIEPGWGLRQAGAEAFSLEMKDVSPMAALLAICEKAKQAPHVYGNSRMVQLYPQADTQRTMIYRNFALLPRSVSLVRTVDFSGPARHELRVRCDVLWDPGVRVVDWKNKARLIEAVTEAGTKLEEAPPAPPPTLQGDPDDQVKSGRQPQASFEIAVKAPADGSQKVTRLRFVATALIAQETSDVTITAFGSPDKARAENDDLEVTVPEPDSGDQWNPEVVIFIRPKKMKPADLAKLPVEFDIKYKDRGDGTTWASSQVTDKGVEYRVRWWTMEGGRHREARAGLEQVRVSVPTVLAERPLYGELCDLSLK